MKNASLKFIGLLIYIFGISIFYCDAQTDASGYPVLAPGTKVMNIIGRDSSGNEISLYSVKAKHVFLFFYETSCHFCEAILPEMIAGYPAWKNKGCEFYSIPLNNDFEGWKQMQKEQHFPWINVIDTIHNEEIRKNFNINVTPTIYALDSAMCIASTRLVRVEMIEAWLKENVHLDH